MVIVGEVAEGGLSRSEKIVESDETELGLLERTEEGAVSLAVSLVVSLVSHRICGGAEGLELVRVRIKVGIDEFGREIGEGEFGDARLAVRP